MNSEAGHVHHPSKSRLLGSSYKEYNRKILQENCSYPVGHLMSPGSSEVPVNDDNSCQDRYTIH